MTTIADLESPADVLGGDTLARKWVIDVDVNYDVDKSTPIWVRVRGITDQSPSEDPTTQDSSTYDSRGWKSTAVTAMGWGWEATVARKVASDGVTYDPGQEYLRVRGITMGPANTVHIRAYEWNGIDGPRVQAYEGLCSVSYQEGGGAMDALSSAQITLSGQGPRDDIPHPLGPKTWVAGTSYQRGEQVFGSDKSVLQATNSGEATTQGDAPHEGDLQDGSVRWKIVVPKP